MKHQIDLIRTIVAALLLVAAVAVILATVATAAGDTHPPELPTLTAPAPGTPRPTVDPYPTISPYPGPWPTTPPRRPGYPSFLPVQVDVEAYP